MYEFDYTKYLTVSMPIFVQKLNMFLTSRFTISVESRLISFVFVGVMTSTTSAGEGKEQAERRDFISPFSSELARVFNKTFFSTIL